MGTLAGLHQDSARLAPDGEMGMEIPEAAEVYTRHVSALSFAVRLELVALIAAGHSYEQVLAADPALTYLDIFAAAREALEVAGQADNAYATWLAAIQERHPRAYAPWSSEEDLQLRQLVEAGNSIDEIGSRL